VRPLLSNKKLPQKCEAGLQALKTYPVNKSKNSSIEQMKEHTANAVATSSVDSSTNSTQAAPLKIKKYLTHFNLSAWWSLIDYGVGSLFNLGKKTQDYTAHQKTAILHASWHFCKKQEDDSLALGTTDADTNTKELEADKLSNKKTTDAPSNNSQLKWAIFNATQAIKQHRKNTRDLLHWSYIAVTWFYALSCGLTVAGAVFVLVGSGGLDRKSVV